MNALCLYIYLGLVLIVVLIGVLHLLFSKIDNCYQFKSPFEKVVYYTFHINYTPDVSILSLSSSTDSDEIKLRYAIYEHISNCRRSKLTYCSDVPSDDRIMTIGVIIPLFGDADKIGYDLANNISLKNDNGRCATLSLLSVRGKL